MAGNPGAHHRERRVRAFSWVGERGETDRTWFDVVRDMRWRLLQERASCRRWRRRFRGGGSALPDALRLESLFDPSARQDARIENHGRSRAGEQKDRTNLEHRRNEIYSGRKRRDARGAFAKREDE